MIGAAGLKIYGLTFSAVPPIGWLASPSVQILAVLWEVVLGCWLISGQLRSVAWLLAVLTFTMFAVVSGSLGLQGVADCGCLGVISSSPWYAFGFDIFAIVLLGLFRPVWDLSEFDMLLKPMLRLSLGGLTLAAVLVALAYTVYGSIPTTVAKLTGNIVDVPSYVDLGEGSPKSLLEKDIQIRNYSNMPVRLIGGTFDCSCVTSSDLPIVIGPNGTATIKIKLRVPDDFGQLTRNAELWTDCDYQPIIRFQIGAFSRPDTQNTQP